MAGDKPDISSTLLVAVAANASPVMEELTKAFESQTGHRVTMSVGATGMLARQAREGAPFDLFVSADMKTVQELADAGIITSETVAPYARGRLVFWQQPRSAPSLKTFDDLVASSARMRIAVANPETAPYGAATRQALHSSGILLSQLKGRIVYGEDVRQTLQFAETGNVDLAFVAAALVYDKKPAPVYVPGILYDPILQGVGVMTSSKSGAAASTLRDYLLSPEAATAYRRFGYSLPERR